MRKEKFLFVKILFLSILLNFSCQKEQNSYHYFSGKALGTTYHIRIHGQGDQISQKDIEKRIAELNQSLSTYISNSLISRINRGEKLRADKHFRYVYEEAKKIYEKTGGLYDPTIGILVNAWGFGPGKRMKNLDSVKVDSLMQYVGFDKVRIDSQGYVIKQNPHIFIDFNSIAKGYVIDQIGELIASKGYKNYLVELGGEVLAKGKNLKENRPWIVAIDYPEQGSHAFITELPLHDEAIATSGNYRKFRVDKETGKKYVHTINALTGFPQQSALLSVSVIAPNCTRADGWATACMAAGFEKAKDFIEQEKDLRGILIYTDSSGKLKIWKSRKINLISR